MPESIDLCKEATRSPQNYVPRLNPEHPSGIAVARACWYTTYLQNRLELSCAEAKSLDQNQHISSNFITAMRAFSHPPDPPRSIYQGNTMSRGSATKRFIDGVFFGYIHMFIDGAIRLVTMPLLLTWLGPQVMGFRAAILELIGYFQKINPGTSQTMQALIERDIRPDTDAEKVEETKGLLSLGVVIQTVLAILSMLSVTFLAFNMDFITEELPTQDLNGSIFFVVCMGFILTITLWGSHHSAILSGQQYHKELELAFLMMKLVQAVLTVLLVWIGYRLWGMAIAVAIGAVVFYVIRKHYADKTGLIIPRSTLKHDKTDVTMMLGTSGWMLLATIGDAMGLQSYRLLAAVLPGMGLTSANQVAILFVLPLLAAQMLAFAGDLVRPALKQKYHAGGFGDDMWPIAKLYLQVTAMLATVIFISSTALNKAFITLWVGAEYYGGNPANQTLTAVLALWVWTSGLKNMLYIRHEMRLRGICSFAEGVLVVVLSVYMGIQWGIAAMFAGGAIAIAVFSTPVYAWFLVNRFKFNFNAASLVLQVTWYPLVVAGAFYYFREHTILETDSWWELIGYAALVGTICLIVSALWLWRPMSPFVLKAIKRR